jgi:hypothetical protein
MKVHLVLVLASLGTEVSVFFYLVLSEPTAYGLKMFLHDIFLHILTSLLF